MLRGWGRADKAKGMQCPHCGEGDVVLLYKALGCFPGDWDVSLCPGGVSLSAGSLRVGGKDMAWR